MPRTWPSVLAACVAAAGCGREREMAETMQLPDTMEVMPAIGDPKARDAMLDTMPGGEMARGDSAAEVRLLKEKM